MSSSGRWVELVVSIGMCQRSLSSVMPEQLLSQLDQLRCELIASRARNGCRTWQRPFRDTPQILPTFPQVPTS